MADLSEDNEEQDEDTMDTKENTAKIDINAWRKRRSFANPNNPLMLRRMSRGEQIWKHFFVYYIISLQQNGYLKFTFSIFSMSRSPRSNTDYYCKYILYIKILFSFIYSQYQGYDRFTRSRQSKISQSIMKKSFNFFF
jgi:hypothetical protein